MSTVDLGCFGRRGVEQRQLQPENAGDDIGGRLSWQRVDPIGPELTIGEIERNQLEAASVGRCVLLYLCGRRFRLCQIPRLQRAPMRDKRPRSFNSEHGRNASQPTRAAIKKTGVS